MTREVPVVILGCGFTGAEVARRARAAGARVMATTRDPERGATLQRLGIEVTVERELSPRAVRDLVGGARVVVAFPPDGHTDARVAPELGRAARLVYLSSTAVYGAARGRVDEETPVGPDTAAARARLEAEAIYRQQGAAVVRAAGIYGPFRGLHRRLLAGDFRMTGDGANVVSRIHAADLAAIALGLFQANESSARGGVYVAADDAPVPQIEAIRWLCDRLGVPLPGAALPGESAPSLRHDRAVDNARIKAALSMKLAFPSYREGFEACLAVEGWRATSATP
jgi:nucleoside-diphosphate-sugar epimerase